MYKGNKGIILKFGDLAKTLSLEDWKTTSLEDLDSDTEWVAIVTDDAEAYLNEMNVNSNLKYFHHEQFNKTTG